MKKILLYKMNYLLDIYIHSNSKTKFELDLSNYAAESDLKNAKGVKTSDFAKKADWANLELYIYRLDL